MSSVAAGLPNHVHTYQHTYADSKAGGWGIDGSARHIHYEYISTTLVADDIYGNSTTVTPLSESCFFCIKF